MNERYLERNVAGERRAQYGPTFEYEDFRQRADDLRRDLILKYAHPEHRRDAEPRNLWREIAKDVLEIAGNREDMIGHDVGTSSGYMIDMLLEEGYRGKLVATDILTNHFDYLRQWLDQKFPDAQVQLGSSNAERLRSIKLPHQKTREPLAESSADFVIAANIMHHTGDPEAVFKAVHRLAKPGAVAIFAGRNETHLANLYEFAWLVAGKFQTTAPESFYHKHDFNLIVRELQAMPEYEIIRVNGQGVLPEPEAGHQDIWLPNDEKEVIWIPNTDEGRNDYWNTLYALLPLMKKLDKGNNLSRSEIEEFIETEARGYFESLATFYEGHFPEGLSQGYAICTVKK